MIKHMIQHSYIGGNDGTSRTSIFSCRCQGTKYCPGGKVIASFAAYLINADQKTGGRARQTAFHPRWQGSPSDHTHREGMILRKRAEEILELVHKTETEIASSDDMLMGDIYIGAGETDSIRLVARAAKQMQLRYPGIQFHISSGNAVYVKESLDRGLIDFGIIFGTVDMTSYHTLKLPATDTWGVLMRKDDPLAEKTSIRREDLWDLPLIVSQQSLPEARCCSG